MAGKRIDDHKFWAGGPSRDSVLPEETRVRSIDDVDGAGDLKRYEDSEETIRSQQEKGIREAESRPMKADYRN
jgi:hypothetical protein